MMKVYRFLMIAMLAVILSGCDLIPQSDDLTDYFAEDSEQVEEPKMEVKQVKFSPDYKTFVVSLGRLRNIGPYSLSDSSQVRVKVEEKLNGLEKRKYSRPRLDSIENAEQSEMERLGLKLLALVDLSLPQSDIEKERQAVAEMRTAFDRHNLYVAFMYGSTLSNTYEVTDYVMATYFRHQPSSGTRIYRSILSKQQEMEQGDSIWSTNCKKALIVFSDGQLYGDNDEPLDPDHFRLEEVLLHPDGQRNDSLTVSFVCVKPQAAVPDEAANSFKALCREHQGLYLDHFDWYLLESSLLGPYAETLTTELLYFTNPDFKVYAGGDNHLEINFLDAQKDSVIGTCLTEIKAGSLYSPIIVRGHTILRVLLLGAVIAVMVAFVIWLLLQVFIPYIKYRVFLKRYVVRYTGSKMVAESGTVEESCYLCKAPFEPGDEVVIKCRHTMHKSCWDENGYHCPEHGRHCQEGSHYYNTANLLDPANSSFRLKWILTAILAAFTAWTIYTLHNHYLSREVVEGVLLSLWGLKAGTPEAANVIEKVSRYLSSLSVVGLTLGFFLTLGLSWLTVRRRTRKLRLTEMFIRGLVAGIGCAVFFLLGDMIEAMLDMDSGMLLTAWIPWAMSGVLIVCASTLGTRIRPDRKIIVAAIVLGIVSMYTWYLFFYDSRADLRVLMLWSYLIFSIGLALCVAKDIPASERFFLLINGPAKEMEVALYKWLRANPEDQVTIGRSRDCRLWMSWDDDSTIGQMAADINLEGGLPRLTALDEGVTVGEASETLAPGQSTRLYHGTTFRIGQTDYCYVEKDK